MVTVAEYILQRKQELRARHGARRMLLSEAEKESFSKACHERDRRVVAGNSLAAHQKFYSPGKRCFHNDGIGNVCVRPIGHSGRHRHEDQTVVSRVTLTVALCGITPQTKIIMRNIYSRLEWTRELEEATFEESPE